MLGDGVAYGGRKFFASQGFQDLGFGEIGVVEHDRENLWMAFGKERAGDSAGTTTSERDFLAERQLCEACEELAFGHALEFGLRADRQGQLREIHQVEVSDEAHADQSWCVRMKCESALDAIIFQEILASGDFCEDFEREILAIEKEAELRFVERGIVEEREQDIG